MLAAIISFIISLFVFLWSAIKNISGLLIGFDGIKGSDIENDDDDIDISNKQASQVDAKANSNDWNKNPVYKDTIRYREGKRYRFVDYTKTYFLMLLSGSVAIISMISLYIMNKNFRSEFNGGGLKVFSMLGNVLKSKIFTYVSAIVVFLILLYIGLKVVFGVSSILLVKDCTPKSESETVESSKIKLAKDGMSWSYNMWIYIKNWEYNNGKKKVFFDKKNSIKMSLGADNPGIELVINTTNGEEVININQICSENNLCANGLDIEKWNMITVSFNNKNVRFYHNGSLIIGKELEGIPSINDSNLVVGDVVKGGSFDGKISDLRYFKKMVSQSDINKLYFRKPKAV